MKKILVNSICALLLFQVVLYITFYVAKKGLTRYNKPVFEQFDLLFREGQDQDLLFIGSSRTHYGINPVLLEKLTGKKVLNAGLEGAKINEMEMVLNGYLLTHRNPEKIFLMLDPHSLDLSNAGVYNKIFLAQYLQNDSLFRLFRQNTGLAAFFWKYLPYSILTEFDDYTRSNCIRGLANKTQLNADQFCYKGYISLNRSYHPEDSVISTVRSADQSGIKILQRIIETCSARKIPLQVLQGPYLETFYAVNKINTIYEKINAQILAHNSVTVQTFPLNYSDKSNFKDQAHLNSTGADNYSMDVYLNFLKNEKKD